VDSSRALARLQQSFILETTTEAYIKPKGGSGDGGAHTATDDLPDSLFSLGEIAVLRELFRCSREFISLFRRTGNLRAPHWRCCASWRGEPPERSEIFQIACYFRCFLNARIWPILSRASRRSTPGNAPPQRAYSAQQAMALPRGRSGRFKKPR
jgi:hypothetical protein